MGLLSLAVFSWANGSCHTPLKPFPPHASQSFCISGSSLPQTQGWAVSSIFDEYTHFASPKARLVDQRVSACWLCFVFIPFLGSLSRALPPAALLHAASRWSGGQRV